MIIAGEPSGDTLGAELVSALRELVPAVDGAAVSDIQPLRTALVPRFFGAGGPRMAAAGVELSLDMMQHSVFGVADVFRNYFKFRRIFAQLRRLAFERQPDAIIGVDFSGFNRRFAHSIQSGVRSNGDWFHPWKPKLIQYVSPQVWASREGRVHQMARDYDLILCLFPFEKAWYEHHAARVPVEFVGHPMVERYGSTVCAAKTGRGPNRQPQVLLLPGSREAELKRHLPILLGALDLMRKALPTIAARMVVPSQELATVASQLGTPGNVEVQVGRLTEALCEADLAMASSGTVSLECAFFGVPTVVLYKLSWAEFQVAKRIVKVKYIAMPNLLAGREIFPEFIQDRATPENLSRAGLDFLRNESRRNEVRAELEKVVTSLGTHGASRRAAEAVFAVVRG
jgi:lipid-A-disaccharide synthase